MSKNVLDGSVRFVAQKNTYRYQVMLDVHDHNTYVFVVDQKTGEVLFDKNVIGSVQNALKAIERLGIKGEALLLYESGSCGFHPFRLFTKAGYACKVIAASSIPSRGSGKRKTDRTDTVSNFQYHMAGALRYVHVPSELEVADREVLRYRDATVKKVAKQKQIIFAFTKRYGLVFELTKTTWTKVHRQWLKKVDAPASIRFVLDAHVGELEKLEVQLSNVDMVLDELFNSNARYKMFKELYSLLPGFGRVNAMTMVLEGGDLARFSHPNALMSYTGLIPGKHSSGTSDPAISITKEGNRFLRVALVNAAVIYRDNRLVYSKEEIETMSCPLRKAFIERLQQRLCMRYRYLRKLGKHSNKVKCAIARELVGFVWELATRIAPELTEYRAAA
jgi:transposase